MAGERSRRRAGLGCVLAALASVLGASLAFEVAMVPTASMRGTVLPGDHLLIFKLLDAPALPGLDLRLPRLRTPRRGELISFASPRDPSEILLKRVIAVAGDTVEMREHVLYRNGLAVAEPYASASHVWRTLPPRTVPPGKLWVMGDNRDQSEDSREFGPVAVSAVEGHPVLVLWSYAAPASEWLDGEGRLRLQEYWSAARHLLSGTRWRRVARLV